MHDVIVINAFHRGDWFIDQLAALGKKVQVFDWSEKLGERSDSEMAGPFGLFGEEKVHAELRAWIDQNYEKNLQPAGWSVWSDFGTFESQGPFHVGQFFQNEKWIERIFKSLTSKMDWPRKKWDEIERPLNSVHDYWTFTSVGPKVRGISLLAEDQVLFQIRRDKKSVQINEQEHSAPFFVFFLNSYEMAPFFDEGLAGLIRGEVLRPRLCWQKMQVEVETAACLQQMPERTLLVEKSEDPWTEHNYLVLHKQKNKNVFDVWFRSYFDFHQQETYFQKIQNQILDVLKNKFNTQQVACVQKPRELLSENYYSLYPIYDPKNWETQSSWYVDGLFYVGTEKVNDFFFSTYWALQNLILQSLKEGKKHG